MNWLIIVAGGKGQRMDLGFNKIFAKLGKFPLLYWTILAFEKSKIVENIIISASSEDVRKIKALVKKHGFKKVRDVIKASSTRQQSTFAVLEIVKSKIKKGELVGVHNAANPFVTANEIKKVYFAAKKHGAALLAQAAKDTVKITNDKGLVDKTPPRHYSWYAQTPQVAIFANLWRAFLAAQRENFAGTDDAQLLERIGIKPKIVPCSHQNIKITFPEDLITAKHILKTWAG